MSQRSKNAAERILKARNDSWRVDETYIKVKKVWMYLYRAVDSEGSTLEFLLSPTRDAEAARRFVCKALQSCAGSASQTCSAHENEITSPVPAILLVSQSAPRVINVDKNAAYPKAIGELKAAGMLPESVELRQVKYLNNLIEQDHQFIKRLTRPGMGFFSFETAWRTLQGFEVMNMLRKGLVQGVEKGDVRGQVFCNTTLQNTCCLLFIKTLPAGLWCYMRCFATMISAWPRRSVSGL